MDSEFGNEKENKKYEEISNLDLNKELENDPIYDEEIGSSQFANTEESNFESRNEKNSQNQSPKKHIFHDPDDEIAKQAMKSSKNDENSKNSQYYSPKQIRVGKNVPLEEVLSHPSLIKMYKQQPKSLITYLCLKVDELIQMCFYSENEDFASKSFFILSSMQEKIVTSFLTTDRFQLLGGELTTPEDPDLTKLGRFTGIISCILDKEPDKLINLCGFLVKLFHHIYLPFVSQLFNKFCKDNPKLNKLQKYLIDFGFDDIVYRELTQFKNVKYENKSEYYMSKDIYRTANILRMIAHCISSKVLEPRFSTVHFLSYCETVFPVEEHVIEDQKWLLILAFVTENFAFNLLNFVFSAVETLKTAKTQFYLCHYYALKFLSQMLRFTTETEELLMASNFIEELLRLMFLFSNNSFFQDAFRKVILSSMRKEHIIAPVVQTFIPALMEMAVDDRYISFRASASIILNSFQNVRGECPFLDKELKEIPDFTSFHQKFMIPRKEIIENTYGEEYDNQIMQISYLYK